MRVGAGVRVRFGGRTDLVGGERAVVELELIDVAVKAARRPPRVSAQEEGPRVLDDRAHLVRGRGRVRVGVRVRVRVGVGLGVGVGVTAGVLVMERTVVFSESSRPLT